MKDTMKTSDIVLASVLKSYDYVLADIEIDSQTTKGYFVFNDVDEDVIQKFDLGQLTVEPVKFHNIIKQLTTSVRRQLQDNR